MNIDVDIDMSMYMSMNMDVLMEITLDYDYQWRNTQKSDFENLYNERLSDEIPLIHKSKSKADLVL